eukprot:TRINITY_DN6610_c0_g1_i2.p2 TRINITY_DN6610_c0_g1~~TRINITY_DN6610_c0_g1_i2.p2  ORF type:complete len:375 (+),score=101.70 TRINITY_DN6610_c0_g1_i2:1295-2419(+)
MLKCAKNWLSLELHPDKIFASYPNLLALIFAIDPSLSKQQAKCISKLLRIFSYKQNLQLKEVREELGKRIFALIPLVDQAFAAANYAIIEFLQSTFAAFCLPNVETLIETPDWKLLDVMQKLTAYQSKEVGEVCIFWKRYFKRVGRMKNKEVKEACVVALKEVIQALIHVCLNRIQLTEESFLDLNAVNSDDELLREVKDNRHDYRKILISIGMCVKAKDYWMLFEGTFAGCVQAINADPANKTPWIQLEAILFTLSALLKGNLAGNYSSEYGDDVVLLKNLFISILSMNKEAVQLQRSVLAILWSISQVLHRVPDVLKAALNHLFQCSSIPLLKEDAADTLLQVMDYNYFVLINADFLSALFAGTVPCKSSLQ